MYYARWTDDGNACWWTIYKKRKWFFDKKVSRFSVDCNIYVHKFFERFVKPELERLNKEG